jgi:hypothetical protein
VKGSRNRKTDQKGRLFDEKGYQSGFVLEELPSTRFGFQFSQYCSAGARRYNGGVLYSSSIYEI